MNKILKGFVYLTLGITVIIYGLFLLSPFIISPILNNSIQSIIKDNQDITGLGLNTIIEDVKLVTTPKLTVGLKIGKFEILKPNKDEILSAKDFQVKMSLLSLLAKKIEVDLVSLEDLDVKLGVYKDGVFEIEKMFIDFLKAEATENTTTTKTTETSQSSAEPLTLPCGLRLSNHLPDIKIGSYDIEFIDLSNRQKYEIEGGKTEITDFVFNKGIKVLASGKATLKNREQFSYKIKINNKIMPDMDLHDLVFNPITEENNEEKKETADFNINILDILNDIYDNKITANLDVDLTTAKTGKNLILNGYANADNLSVSPSGLTLPSSDVKLKFKGEKIDINSNLYTAQNEVSTIIGTIKTGKNTNIDINFKSGAELANIMKIIKAVALTFNIKDLQTLTANGKLDADFNIKSNLKTVTSNGYLKIPSAKINYGLYNVSIDDINANVELNNNNIDIKNIGFAILGQPLKFYGSVKQDATADLHLTANNLGLKGLLIALGQGALLKDNNVNSGTVTLNADIVGKLNSIKPTAKVLLSNLDIKNVPANTVLKLPNTTIDIISDGKTFSGNANSTNIKAINPAATVSVPKVLANITPDYIEITQTPVNVEKINFNVAGKIKNYLTEKIALDFVTTGDIKSTLKGDMNIVKQTLNLVYATTQDSTIVVPMFDKSKLTFNCNIGIGGEMINPILSGVVNVPSLNIPEIPVTMENLVAKLNGPILKGSATVGKFASGGIGAENLTTDFLMKGENFYLNNLKGTAFDGNINGNIIYNMSNFKTSIDFHGQGLNAEKAVKGAVGISNALSGTLGFDTKLSLDVVDYEEMMKSMKGNLTFKVENGSFGNIGRIENLFGANNIISNSILKTTVATLSNISGIKETAKFNYINGDMSFSDGWANLTSIKSSGNTLAYFVYGKLHLINLSTNVTVLGRLDSSVVALLGPLGELSADKLFSYIPKFGALTSSIVNTLTTNPKGERISEIPALSNGSESYKDFKVIFNGGLESSNSIKSFKWLTDVDTSAIEQVSVKDTIKSLKTTVDEDLTNTVQSVVDTVKSQKDALKTTADELKNLFKF